MSEIRAVIYCRCSTEEESQKDALVKQVQEAKESVRNQGWILSGSYVEAKSGTTVKGRAEYNRLFRDLETEKFDIIVIKSQDRLMRNTKDWYIFLDRMQKQGKRLYMYLERKFYNPEDALITGIKAILAEEYSRELSKKINNAHRHRQLQGEHFVFTKSTYGLKKDSGKNVVIDEDEAKMIRLAFQLSAEGYGTYSISNILWDKGYRNRKGEKINASVLRKIIRNPIYKGTIVQNQRHFDFESKKTVHNPPEEWIIHEHAIPAIVDDELFQRANDQMDARQSIELVPGEPFHNVFRRYCFSGKIKCGLCGTSYTRCSRKVKGNVITEWKCRKYTLGGRENTHLHRARKSKKIDDVGCDNVHMSEEKLMDMVEELYQQYFEYSVDGNNLIGEVMSLLEKVLKEETEDNEVGKIEDLKKRAEYKKKVLLEKLLEGIISDSDFKKKNEELEEEIAVLEQQLDSKRQDIQKREHIELRLAEIKDALEDGILKMIQMEDMMESVHSMIVYPDRMEIHFQVFRLLGLYEEAESVPASEIEKKIVIMPQKCNNSYRLTIEAEKQKIMDIMKETPKITAKEIATAMGKTTTCVQARIRELNAEHKIRYSTPNGRGHWIVE